MSDLDKKCETCIALDNNKMFMAFMDENNAIICPTCRKEIYAEERKKMFLDGKNKT